MFLATNIDLAPFPNSPIYYLAYLQFLILWVATVTLGGYFPIPIRSKTANKQDSHNLY